MTSVVRITKNTILCESRKVYEEIFIGDTQFKQLHMTTVTSKSFVIMVERNK